MRLLRSTAFLGQISFSFLARHHFAAAAAIHRRNQTGFFHRFDQRAERL
jgi:hypothetical protein